MPPWAQPLWNGIAQGSCGFGVFGFLGLGFGVIEGLRFRVIGFTILGLVCRVLGRVRIRGRVGMLVIILGCFLLSVPLLQGRFGPPKFY